jgi:hypothetical protein
MNEKFLLQEIEKYENLFKNAVEDKNNLDNKIFLVEKEIAVLEEMQKKNLNLEKQKKKKEPKIKKSDFFENNTQIYKNEEKESFDDLDESKELEAFSKTIVTPENIKFFLQSIQKDKILQDKLKQEFYQEKNQELNSENESVFLNSLSNAYLNIFNLAKKDSNILSEGKIEKKSPKFDR